MLYLYTAWFRDNHLSQEVSAAEWSSCLVIDAESDQDGRMWGDHLADLRTKASSSLTFLRSTVEKADSWPRKKIENVICIQFGEALPAKQIGW